MTLRRKTPYMKKKDSYEKDFYAYASGYVRRGGQAKEKRRQKRLTRRKINQIVTQITSQFEPSTADLLSTKALEKGCRSRHFYDKVRLKEWIQKKRERRAVRIVLQNFFKESSCLLGCCYFYVASSHYEHFCSEKKNRFKNFFASVLTHNHGLAQEIAVYLFECYNGNSPWGYSNAIQASLESFFREEPEWEVPVLRWMFSSLPSHKKF